MSTDEAIAKLRAMGVSAFTDPLALVKALAQAVGTGQPVRPTR
jgi:hypothetical protein